ncbi:GH25 family lysozyme [Arthrobacter sp. SLBN-100]|uniref:GH25 family lysozyme n=1 Tax=Arthrobacter sp. SLBN-100 TaxID=2768450 RepID=UPI001F179478|nr:GH25 family lysozyme [Arthrobacter sp. SLBN-100]
MGQGLEKLSRQSVSAEGLSTEATYMPPGIQGLDVSSHQGSVDWQQQRNMGALFAYVKASEATTYLNPQFSGQYSGARNVGMIRGAYHFAIPSVSSGAAQAAYFVRNGGAWSGDGWTLPPLLDIEYNPYSWLGNTCYNMSASDMILWIADFSNNVYTLTGRYPAIYTTTDWWTQCTGNTPAFRNQPLHIASYRTVNPGTLPAGWTKYDIWQYSSLGPFAGDSNVFSGSYAELQALASGFDPVLSKYNAMGGTSSRLGAQTLPLYCGLRNGGCYRQYNGGQIIWSGATGAKAVYFSAIGGTWRDWGGVDGRLGYPTSDEACSVTMCWQDFQGGSIYWSTSTPSIPVFNGGIGARWLAMGGTKGILGFPLGDETCTTTACSQTFQGGRILWTAASGPWAIVPGNVANAWLALGAENSRLGYPIENQNCTNSQCAQGFQGGIMVWSQATGAIPVWRTSIGATWQAQGGLAGPLGAPLAQEACQLSTCRQTFVNGEIFWDSHWGAQIVRNGAISKKWKELQAELGRYGAPTGGTQYCLEAECFQNFVGGTILKEPGTSAPAFGVLNGTGIGSMWAKMGGQQARLGYPASDESCSGSTCQQTFRGGTIYWTPNTGQWAVYDGAIGALWTAQGAQKARLGFPVSNETCAATSCRQSFQGGDVLWTGATGAAAVFSGGIGSLWKSLGSEAGRLGFPTNSETCGLSSCTQSFTGGQIFWASGVGIGAVYNSGIGGLWRSNGAQNGFFGFPTNSETCSASECWQNFQGGSITWSAAAGYVVRRY